MKGVWGSLGRALGTLGRPLPVFWTFKIISCWSIGSGWPPRGLL